MNATDLVTGAWIVIGIYMLVITIIVYRSYAGVKSMSDYALGSIIFSPAMVGLSLAASMTSAATFIINPGFIANFGLSGVISYGFVLPIASMVSLVLLTKSFRKYGESIKALTLAQWIGKRYNSTGYAFFMAVLALLLITFIVLIVVAIAQVLAKALAVNIIYVTIGVVIFVFGYMMFGGANSMVYTNTIQALTMVVVAIILLLSGYEYFKDGLGVLFDRLTAIDPKLTRLYNPESPLFRNFYEIFIAQIVVGIAIVVQPHIITKSLLLKKESDVNRYLAVAIIVQMLFFLVVITGLYARLRFPDLMLNGVPMKNDTIISTYVTTIFNSGILAVGVGLIVILGLIFAGISTLEGLIQSVSTTISMDLIKPILGKRAPAENKLIRMNNVIIILMGVVTILLAIYQIRFPKLSVGIFAQNGVYAYFASAFVPVIFGIFYPKMRTGVAFTASVAAFITHFTVYYVMPYLVSKGMSFGTFDVFLTGTVKNPAIACSVAILVSVLVAMTGIFLTKGGKHADAGN